jgi:hypothetical protein
VVIIEHNLEVIRVVDWVIDLGPEAGKAGGQLVFEGSPQMLIDYGQSTLVQGVPKGRHRSYTAEALAQWESVRTGEPGSASQEPDESKKRASQSRAKQTRTVKKRKSPE